MCVFTFVAVCPLTNISAVSIGIIFDEQLGRMEEDFFLQNKILDCCIFGVSICLFLFVHNQWDLITSGPIGIKYGISTLEGCGMVFT